MSNSQPTHLQVTRALSNCARAADFQFGEDTALVAVQHMLEQTVDLFRTAGNMGLNLKNIFALGKVYSNSVPVIERLRGMGVTVLESSTPPPGEFYQYFEQDTYRLWRVVVEALASRRIKRVLVLDDGGVCITNVPPEILRRYAVSGVEQTSQGIFRFAEKPPPFAVISWARSAVKLHIGGPIFSQCFVHKLNTKFVGGGVVKGKRLGIIGLGSIGAGVASLTVRQGNEVLFFDPNPKLHIPQSLQSRVRRVDSLEELMVSCDYVFGCSGRDPFKDKWPLDHTPGIKLLSVSGGDQEFGPIIRALRNKPGFEVATDTWNITSEQGPSGALRIGYLGYPYTFVSRALEAVPSWIVQLETGGLLAALVQARLHLDLCETGEEQNRGVHRVSPEAQRFIYELWLREMKERNIDIVEQFGYDPATLNAAQHDRWIIENSEPHPGEHKPVASTEQVVAEVIRRITD